MVTPRTPTTKHRTSDRQPFFLWLILFGLLFQVDHLRRVSSNQTEEESEPVTVTPAVRGAISASNVGRPKFPPLNRYKIPNVLVVGTQKAGTNSMASWMFRHLNVCQPVNDQGKPVNGVHFFNTDDKYLKLGIDAYGSHFRHCNPKNYSIVMDATPDYLPLADRIRETYDLLDGPYAADLKIVMVMREPVERELSWYNHLVHVADEDWTPRHLVKQVREEDGSTRNFQAYLDKVVIPDIDNTYGLYAKWFKKWTENFDRKQILVLSFDELQRNPKSFQKRVKDFLKLKPNPNEDLREIVNLQAKSGAPKRAPISCQAQESLAGYFKESNKEFYDLLASSKGPAEQQKPFPKFQLEKCKPWKQSEQQQQGKNNNNNKEKNQQQKTVKKK